MSSRATATATRRSRRPVRSRQAAAVVRRRRLGALLVGLVVAAGLFLLVRPTVHQAVQEIALPLRHEDIIRQQARDKGLDPALIAAVIFAESHFIDGRSSSAGALGLMQLTPHTAHDIARKSGGTQFEVADLGTPQVNIAYGSYYLRYLMGRYAEDETLVLAAYNAGEGNVDRWLARARDRGQALTVAAIPFGETRAYVRKVLAAHRDYRTRYRTELGL